MMTRKEESYYFLMLSRLKEDCINYIADSTYRLWGVTIEDHIEEMKRLYLELEYKPNWIDMSTIQEYRREMTSLKEALEKDFEDELQQVGDCAEMGETLDNTMKRWAKY